MSVKKIERVIAPGGTHFVGDGFRVHNIIPGSQGLSMQRMSPFIMLDYNSPYHFPASDTPRGSGYIRTVVLKRSPLLIKEKWSITTAAVAVV